MRLRPDVAVLLAGVATVVVLLSARAALLPPPPRSTPMPEASELQELSAFLSPVEPVEQGPQTIASVRGDPFGMSGRPASGPGEGGAPRVVAAPRPRWRLSGIMITGPRRVAIINDRMVAAGDTLPGGLRVESVASDHVIVVLPDGRRRRLDLQT